MLVTLAAILNRSQQEIIDLQSAQITTLLEIQGRKRLRLNADQRRVLAVKAKAVGYKALQGLTTIVTPDTLMRWQPEQHPDVRALIDRMAQALQDRQPGGARSAAPTPTPVNVASAPDDPATPVRLDDDDIPMMSRPPDAAAPFAPDAPGDAPPSAAERPPPGGEDRNPSS